MSLLLLSIDFCVSGVFPCVLEVFLTRKSSFDESCTNTNVLCVFSPEHRCIESAKIRNKYPDRVPVSQWRQTACDSQMCAFPCSNRVCLPSGDRGESIWITYRGHWQEEVLGPIWYHSGSVHVDHQETHPAAIREGHLPVCGQDSASVQVRTKNLIG